MIKFCPLGTRQLISLILPHKRLYKDQGMGLVWSGVWGSASPVTIIHELCCVITHEYLFGDNYP